MGLWCSLAIIYGLGPYDPSSKSPNKALKVWVAPYFIIKIGIKMAEKRKKSSTKRFGARYGRTVKDKFAKIEGEQRKLHKCPYCRKIAVKRISTGIWYCKKCNAKFAGKAYTIANLKSWKNDIVEEELKTGETS
jgi:large subunit ribosomal protein L37Ae